MGNDLCFVQDLACGSSSDHVIEQQSPLHSAAPKIPFSVSKLLIWLKNSANR